MVLKSCLEYLKEGDILRVTHLDRLARSTAHLCEIDELLQRKGVLLQVIDQSIDTGNATGRLLFNMLASIAQFENEIRKERQMDGIRKAKERGVRFGRYRSITKKQLVELKSKKVAGVLVKDLAEEYGVRPMTIYRWLKAPS